MLSFFLKKQVPLFCYGVIQITLANLITKFDSKTYTKTQKRERERNVEISSEGLKKRIFTHNLIFTKALQTIQQKLKLKEKVGR
jgi:hypothetical protein